GPLVVVEHQEEPGIQIGAVGDHATPGLAARRLDLDDVGAEPAEHLRAARSRLILSEVQHHDPVERLGHAFLRGPEPRARTLRARGASGPSRPPARYALPRRRPGSAGPSPSPGAWGDPSRPRTLGSRSLDPLSTVFAGQIQRRGKARA